MTSSQYHWRQCCRGVALGVLFLAGGGLTGCSVENDNDVACIAKDCGAFCQALGFQEGSCTRGDQCECGPRSTDMYTWKGDTGTDTDTGGTDTDTGGSDADTGGTDMDTGGTDMDTGGTDATPDGGADSGPGSN